MDTKISLGFVLVNRMWLAVPANSIEEVASGPFNLSELPSRNRHVMGIFSLRGTPVPVVDIASYLDPAATTELIQKIDTALVLNLEGKLLAIPINRASEVRRVDAKDLTPIAERTEDCTDLFSQVYTSPDDGSVTAVLDLPALFKHSGVRPVSASPRRFELKGEKKSEDSEYKLIFWCRGMQCAIDASLVVMVDHLPEAIESPFPNDVLEGFSVIREQKLAVVNFGALLGLPERSNDLAVGGGFIVVLASEGRVMAAVIDSVHAIERLPCSEMEPFSDTGLARSGLISSTIAAKSGGVTLVVDQDALYEHSEEMGYFFQLKNEGDLAELAGRKIGKPKHYLVFRLCGCQFASELACLDSVSLIPDDFVSLKSEENALKGICSRLGRTIKVYDLAIQLGISAASTESEEPMLLVVRSGNGLVGFFVDSVDFLKWSVPSEIANRDEQSGAIASIRIQGRSSQDESIAVLDIEEIANKANGKALVPTERSDLPPSNWTSSGGRLQRVNEAVSSKIGV